jgi:hypothetical protein
MRWIYLAALAVLPVFGAQAACHLDQFSVMGVSASYDPFEENFTPAPVTITLRADRSGDCRDAQVQFALTYAPSSPQNGTQLTLKNGGSSLSARLEGPPGRAHPVSDPVTAFQNDPNSYRLSHSGSLASSPDFQLVVIPGQSVPPGYYTADLLLLVRVTDSHNDVSNSSAPLSLAVRVKPSVRLAAGSGNMTIDVGELRSGSRGGPVRFDAYANVNYELRLISDNDFALVRDGHGSSGDGVAYEPFVSGIAVEASGKGGSDHTRSIEFTAPGGGGLRHHRFDVTIPSVAGVRAGYYSDLMTIEIRAEI